MPFPLSRIPASIEHSMKLFCVCNYDRRAQASSSDSSLFLAAASSDAPGLLNFAGLILAQPGCFPGSRFAAFSYARRYSRSISGLSCQAHQDWSARYGHVFDQVFKPCSATIFGNPAISCLASRAAGASRLRRNYCKLYTKNCNAGGDFLKAAGCNSAPSTSRAALQLQTQQSNSGGKAFRVVNIPGRSRDVGLELFKPASLLMCCMRTLANHTAHLTSRRR